jgi:hypothetical protein
VGRISQLPVREARPLERERRGQTRLAVYNRLYRSAQLALDQRVHHLQLRAFAFLSRKPQVHNFAPLVCGELLIFQPESTISHAQGSGA